MPFRKQNQVQAQVQDVYLRAYQPTLNTGLQEVTKSDLFLSELDAHKLSST